MVIDFLPKPSCSTLNTFHCQIHTSRSTSFRPLTVHQHRRLRMMSHGGIRNHRQFMISTIVSRTFCSIGINCFLVHRNGKICRNTSSPSTSKMRAKDICVATLRLRPTGGVTGARRCEVSWAIAKFSSRQVNDPLPCLSVISFLDLTLPLRRRQRIPQL